MNAFPWGSLDAVPSALEVEWNWSPQKRFVSSLGQLGHRSHLSRINAWQNWVSPSWAAESWDCTACWALRQDTLGADRQEMQGNERKWTEMENERKWRTNTSPVVGNFSISLPLKGWNIGKEIQIVFKGTAERACAAYNYPIKMELQ